MCGLVRHTDYSAHMAVGFQSLGTLKGPSGLSSIETVEKDRKHGPSVLSQSGTLVFSLYTPLGTIYKYRLVFFNPAKKKEEAGKGANYGPTFLEGAGELVRTY